MNIGKNILCVRIDSMGDVIMTTPAFRAIKESIKDSRITLLTSNGGKKIAKYIPFIDDIIAIDLPWEKDNSITDNKQINQLIRNIKKKNFDSAIIFTVSSQSSLPSALVCYLANIPIRIGYTKVNPHMLLTHYLPDMAIDTVHEVVRQLQLVESIGCKTDNVSLTLNINNEAKIKVLEKIKNEHIFIKDTFIIVHAGAAVPWRRYNAEGFIEAGRELKRNGYQLLFTATANENGLIDYIVKNIGPGAHSLAGLLTIEEFVACISLSSLLISNNTGAIHIAAATNTPVVDLYALTNPQHTPWDVKHKVLYFPIKEKKFYHSDTLPISMSKSPLRSPIDIVDAANELLSDSLQKRQVFYD